VQLTVFNTLGQQVATLVEGGVDAGYHEVKFDASELASGVYLYRMQVALWTPPSGGTPERSGENSSGREGLSSAVTVEPKIEKPSFSLGMRALL